MALTKKEVFANLEELFGKLKNAVEVDSDGGEKITKSEAVQIGTGMITGFGIDIVDDD